MAGKTLNFHIDGDNCISVTMSESGRVSLSDIAAATIGNLDDVCWSEQQTSRSTECTADTGVPVTHANRNIASETWDVLKSDHDAGNLQSVPVLRPWEKECAVSRPDNTYRPVVTECAVSRPDNTYIPVVTECAVSRPDNTYRPVVTECAVTRPEIAYRSAETECAVSRPNYTYRSGETECAVIIPDNKYRSRETECAVRQPDSTYISGETECAVRRPDITYRPGNIVTSQQVISPPQAKPPPSYLEHINRRYDDTEQDKENQVSKRFKTEPVHTASNLSDQISSFYKSARNSPLSTMSDQFSYPALSNFVKHEPPSPHVKQQQQQQQQKSTLLYQPWSYMSKIPDITISPLHSSAPMPNTSQPMFSVPRPGFSEVPSYLPHTPVGKSGGSLFMPSYESPGMDSRMNDSLGLLGSPQMNSPVSTNPYFSDLKALLSSECKTGTVPQSLFSMQEKDPSPKKEPESVFSREQKLQERFTKLQPGNPEEVRQMSSFFRYQTALIETERFKTLHECQYPKSYKDSINTHFDNKLHVVIDRVEKSVELLEKAKTETKAARVTKPRPHLRREAVELMEEWYAQNMDHPYPTASTVEYLAGVGNTGVDQVKKWFANKRSRSQNTRSLTEIAMKKRKLGQLTSS